MEKSQDLLSKCETFFIFNPDLFDSKDDEKKNNVLAIKCVMCVMIMNIQNQFSMININHESIKKDYHSTTETFDFVFGHGKNK